jgi:hypothetical protein
MQCNGNKSMLWFERLKTNLHGYQIKQNIGHLLAGELI